MEIVFCFFRENSSKGILNRENICVYEKNSLRKSPWKSNPFNGWFETFSCPCCAQCATWKLLHLEVCICVCECRAGCRFHTVKWKILLSFSFQLVASIRTIQFDALLSPLTKSIFEAVKEFLCYTNPNDWKCSPAPLFIWVRIQKCDAEKLIKRIASRTEKFCVVKNPGFSFLS